MATAEPSPEDRPHVLYRLFDATKRLLYVGITCSPGMRFSQHRDEKDWWRQVAAITLEHFDSRGALTAAERAAIRAEQPLFNVLHVPRPPREDSGGSRRTTPMRTTQVDDATWALALRIAALRGETMSQVMRDAVRRYVARHRHLLDDNAEQPPA